ncbi:hypothetical protein GW17_00017387 [Ensete ventricosum]|nr:hypothetical protein GW17_00017387 [Ensete ventricosum]RZS27086.1 hypothetical protein BHM03_00060518 [Ensete ventricosum]
MDSYQLFPAISDSPTAADEPGRSKSAAVVKDFIGFLEVFIYQARDIHNICIYHKQDVYAKLCLTSDPDVAVSTRIINGGGRNPVFNENLRLSVRTIESSLKCEIWMLSRVKNYLEDQLLGFALVPLSDVLLAKAKLVQEFSLSSTDLFHSPAGFVQLSLSYIGASLDVMAITAVPKTVIGEANLPDSETEDSIPCEYEKIEFPDLKVANENQQMVSEYFGLQSTDMETQSSESLVTSESGNCVDDDAGVRLVESFSSAKRLGSLDSDVALKNDTTISSVSMAESSPVTLPVASQSISDMLSVTASPSRKDKSSEVTDGEADSSGLSKVEFMRPITSINIVPEQTVVQQDIVDMYMKSMQEFTESLAKMKLPMDMETSSSPIVENGTPDSERKATTPKGIGSKIFYGSRAFF